MATVKVLPNHRYAAGFETPALVPFAAVVPSVRKGLEEVGFEQVEVTKDSPSPKLPKSDAYAVGVWRRGEAEQPVPPQATGIVDMGEVAEEQPPVEPDKRGKPGPLTRLDPDSAIVVRKVAGIAFLAGALVAAIGAGAIWYVSTRKKQNPKKKKKKKGRGR